MSKTKSQSNAARETVQRFIVSDSGAGSCVIDTQTSRFSAFYQVRGNTESIANEMNRHADPVTLACWESGAAVNVEITLKDGETITEKKVNEVHNYEETLFLRRYGSPGLEFDQCDVASFKVI